MASGAIENVGLIGLGRMGRPMARHLAAAGFGTFGCDRDPAAAAAAEGSGVFPLATCAEVARRSQAVIVVVGFESQVEEAIFGRDGLATGASPGTVLMIASTVAPSYMAKLAHRTAEHGLTIVDTPVARGEAAAEAGRLLVFAGGPEDVLERCRPVLDCFAERICHLGKVGAGQVAKAINNMLLWTCVSANVEGLDLAEALGVDREALRAALGHSSGANWALETRAEERPALWAEKDMMIVLEEAKAARVAVPVCGAVKDAITAFKIARNLPTPKTD